ncbi:hypothetical protein PHYSODRAFT_295143 [Phytophthora sojae]|uniref:Uncharacterized protein n=1 Tax=Phytophthora sojae (strain P6497) TaxID=1094619 RepID=G4YQN6_PHYSP|nr:hypothetical protein PHYSODRAFT_295143 [Phytophthora sojae]EGZ30300.1 hypothetical protein PHYSODRAFT_295143 [Phytophthora sojae]|eukprot:XP_009517575.1 hypothetical protein PHYSODRAFT_295143 [Phytophthora sojae]
MEKKNVAYRPLGDLAPYYFSWNGTKSIIFDPAYVFASPRRKNYNHFMKEGCLEVYMNPWSRTECQGLADALHLNVQVKNEWLRKYALVGGKPRIWFSPSKTYECLVQQLKADIPRDIDDLKRMIHLFRQGDFDERTRHNLFSICRDDDDPSRSYWVYSSLAVEARICAR